MNHRIESYLESLNLTKVAYNRVREVHEFFGIVCPEELRDALISEYITEEGLREYESIWFFSDTYLMEAKDFLHTDHFDLVALKLGVLRWEIQGQDYDYKNATSSSRINLSILLVGSYITGSMRASRENCDALMARVQEYIVPNIVPEKMGS